MSGNVHSLAIWLYEAIMPYAANVLLCQSLSRDFLFFETIPYLVDFFMLFLWLVIWIGSFRHKSGSGKYIYTGFKYNIP
jgi:hypothetical protein